MTAAAVPVAARRSRLGGATAFSGTAAMVAATAAAQGSYFPTSWGWSAVALAWAGAVTVALGPRISLSHAALGFGGAFVALAAWIACSNLWTTSPTQTPLEVERALVYVAGATAALVVATRVRAELLAGAVVTGATLICLYSLATRLFPDRLGVYDPIAGYRLAEPIGYWNGLGAFAAIALVAALGLVARAPMIGARAASAGAVPVLATTIYFTYSRGAWIALFAALVFLVALDPRRLQLVAAVAAPVAVSAGTILYASRQPALTRTVKDLATSVSEGKLVALAVVLAALASAVASAGVASLRVHLPERAERAAAVALAVVAAGTLAAGSARYGDPVTIVRNTAHQFAGSPPATGSNLNARLFTLSGSGRWQQWQVAWAAWKTKPAFGVGAGAYERYWMRDRTYPGKVRDVHNLYLEMLTELGPLGLLLALAAIGAPIAAGIAARQTALGLPLAAAWIVYAVHALADWDWELAAVGLAAIVLAAAVLVQARATVTVPRHLVAGLLCLTGLLALGGLASNLQLSRAGSAIADGRTQAAVHDARRGARFAPWSAQPYQRLAEAYADAGRSSSARTALLKALRKDDGDWQTWYELAQVSTGADRASAFAHARRLNPFAPPLKPV